MMPERDRPGATDDLFSDERFSVPPIQPCRLGRRAAIAWVLLAVVVLGAIATLLIWVSHRIGSVAG